MGERLTVQFARGSRHREGAPGAASNSGGFGNQERAPPRPRRTPHRMQITGLPSDTSWQVCLPPRSLWRPRILSRSLVLFRPLVL